MPSYKLKGVEVQFPYDAYDCQLVYMESVIGSLQEGDNALLESPTGTGKTLCLLCASLAWRESLAEGYQTRLSQSNKEDKPKLPTIVYASRTHSQLQQVIHELKVTPYRPKMVVLGSREQLCIHKDVKKLRGTAQNNVCRKKCKARTCNHHLRVADYVKSHTELGSEPIDIEDFVAIGRTEGPCPYFLTRELHNSAEIIFVPYNYLIDKENRKSLSIVWENSVIIFDEAHNLEGICADAASFDLPGATLAACISEASQCVELAALERSSNNAMDKSVDPENFAVLRALLMELEKKINELPIDENGFTRPGQYIYEFLSELRITWETVTMLVDTIDYAISLLQGDSASAVLPNSRGTTCRLETFRDALRTVFRERDGSYADSYKLHIQHSYRKTEEKGAKKGENKSRTFSWWCFNPGIAMEEFKTLGVRTIILTSGTLAPLESFAIELKLNFKARLENPHVIGPSQIWVGVVSSGPSGRPLNSSYRSRDSPEYKTELGNTIVNFARIVPDGLLVFFPSYYLLNSCVDAWHKANPVNPNTVWDRICKHKQPVVEPKESALFNTAHEDFLAKLKDRTCSGAVFFAVCRGKVSEGLDFADQTGRAVIVTGIPFAMMMDPKVRLKREYLDEQAKLQQSGTHKVLRGEEWYMQQASRAVNQAVGRVIRHKNDYGAIILCDERFSSHAQKQLSLWLRPHLKHYTRFGDAAFTLTRFFKDKAECSLLKPQPINLSYRNKASSSSTFEDAFLEDPVEENLIRLTSSSYAEVEERKETREQYGEIKLAKVEMNAFLGRKTTEPLNAQPASGPAQARSLSAILADKRNQQLSSLAITPANRATGSNSNVFALKEPAGEPKRRKVEAQGRKAEAQTSASSAPAKNSPNASAAKNYLAEVKARLTGQEYQRFTNSMKEMKEDPSKLESVFTTIARLFAAPERKYLLTRFGSFLPSRLQSKFQEHLKHNETVP